eukprot:jgi/Galph1/3260/GphlegSOOS_G1933.1
MTEADDFTIPSDINCPCIAQLQESSCRKDFLSSFSCYLKHRSEGKGEVICKPEFERMETCMLKYPDEFSENDINMFRETVRSGFKFRDFLGFSKSIAKGNKSS